MKSDRFNIALGKNIQEMRLKKHLRQEVLAEKAELSRTTIANIEAGRQNITVINLAAIAEALDIAVANLIPSFTENIKEEAEKSRTTLRVDGRSHVSDATLQRIVKKYNLPVKGA